LNRNLIKKVLVASFVIALIATFWALGLGRYLTISYLRDSMGAFAVLYAEHRVSVLTIYFVIYVLATSLSLPGAVVLTIAGGALFGFLMGTLIVSFASSIGATLACLFARFVLRDWVQNRFRAKIAKINEGMEKEGAFYLFTMRLVPVFPFWIINLVMGLTKMPLWRFYWVSQLGMLAGTMVYVNAGKQIAQIDSLKGILSPGLIVSFTLLGVFPILTKRLLAAYRRRKGQGAAQTSPEEENSYEGL
jgi:uncharacterized membrane protein YdjX (TVP38/TMEM64 family)